MPGASCEAKLEFPDLSERLERAQQRIEQAIAATVQTNVGMRFDNEGAWNGHDKWDPLKRRKGQILSLTGTLRRSIAPRGAKGTAGPQGFVRSSGNAADMLVEVGTVVAYAAVHNNGAVIQRAQSMKAFKIYTSGAREGQHRFASAAEAEKGGGRNHVILERDVKAHEIKIPRRNFTDLNAQDEQEIADTLADVLAAVLEGR